MQNEEVSHFRHVGYLRSAAPCTQGDLYLTAALDSNQSPTGSVVCATHPSAPVYRNANQIFWLYTDQIQSVDVGAGYIASALYSLSSGVSCHDIATTSYQENTPKIDFSSYPTHPRRAEFYFRPDTRNRGGFVITHAFTGRVLTAGTSASDSSITTSRVSCTLVDGQGQESLNQIWYLENVNELFNCNQISPSLATEMSILAPGQSSQTMMALGLGTYDEDDVTPVWEGIPSSYQSGTDLDVRAYERRPVPESDDTSWLALKSMGVGSIVQQVSGSAGTPLTYASTNASLKYETRTGTYRPRQYRWSTVGTPSSSDGQQELAPSPYTQTLSSDVTSDNAPQFWYAFPRNFYDASLPTPSDIRVMITDEDEGKTWELKSLDQIPWHHAVTITPKFICDWDAYVAVLRIRYRRQSQYATSASWGDWQVVSVPESSNWGPLASAPWATPNGPQAWIANAWAGDQDSEGYTSLSRGFSFPSGIFSGMADAVAEVSISIRAFSYGPWRNLPGLPYQGPVSTFTALVANRPDMRLTPDVVTDEGIKIHYLLTNWDRSQLSLRIDSLEYYMWRRTPDVMVEPYETQIFPQDPDGDFRWEGDIIVPMAKLNPDVMPGLISELYEADQEGWYGQLDVRGTLISQFGERELDHQSEIFHFETGTTQGQHLTEQLGQFATIYRPTADVTPSYAWQRISTERGPRYIATPIVGTSVIARHMVGAYVSPDDPEQAALLFFRDSSDVLSYSIASAAQSIPLKLATLSYMEDDLLYVIPLQGKLSVSYGTQRDVSTARVLGGRKFIAGGAGGEAPTISFSGTIFRHQLTGVQTPSSQLVKILTSIQDIYSVPLDATLMLRTPYGQAHMVRLTGIDSPRSSAGYADISLSMVEVEG